MCVPLTNLENLMSKTIRMSDVARDARHAKQQVEDEARAQAQFRVVDSFEASQRGAGGFGSTGAQ